MDYFSQRRKGCEAEFTRNQEHAFRITARRNRLFGLWAAVRLGLKDDAALTYAGRVMDADFAAPGDQDVIEKARSDLVDKGIAVTEGDLRVDLARATLEARRQLSPP